MHYLKGQFVFDLLAQISWPMRYFLKDSWTSADVSLIYLLRLFRLGKILILMNLQKFTGLVRNYYRKNLVKNIHKNQSKIDKSIDNNKIMQQIFLIKGFQVMRLIFFILILAYFLGTLWFCMTLHTSEPGAYTFYNEYGLEDRGNIENLTVVVYFMFTTLSTVGFGDFNPKSEIERVLMTFILLIGVACFSWIMSQFIEILLKVQSVTAENEDSV